MPELGRAALILCLGLSLYAAIAGSLAARERRRRLAVSAQNALIAAFGAAAVAAAVLLSALARHDFSFTYVADHTSRQLPTLYTLTAAAARPRCATKRFRDADAPVAFSNNGTSAS